MLVFFAFLLCLAWGSVSTLFWIPENEIGRGYFQMNALIVLGLLSLAIAARWLHPFEPFGSDPTVGAGALYLAFGGAFLYYGAVWRESWRWVRWPAALVLLSLGWALWEIAPVLARAGRGLPAIAFLSVLAMLSSALLLGWSLITMLLGHWYLIAPKLTFRHLTLFSWILLGIVALRIVAVGVSLWAASSAPAVSEPTPWRLLTDFEGEAMFFWVRVLWGLAGPLLLGLMALSCARKQANQSATGILYVLVVGSFIGEITAYFLMLTTGVPV
jgi:hypothetical protein